MCKRAQHLEALDGQLTHWHNDQSAQSVGLTPALSMQQLDDWDEVGESLARASSSSHTEVTLGQCVRDGCALHLRHSQELSFEQTSRRLLGQRQLIELDLDLPLISSVGILAFLGLFLE